MKFKFKHVFNTYRMLIKVKFSLLEIYMEISEHSKKFFFSGKKIAIFLPTLSKYILVCKIGRDLKISLKCRHILVLIQLVSILPSFYLFLRFLNKCKNFPLCPIFHYAPPPPYFQPFYSHFCDFLGQFWPIFAYLIILAMLIFDTDRPYVFGHISAYTYPICFIQSLFESYFQGL